MVLDALLLNSQHSLNIITEHQYQMNELCLFDIVLFIMFIYHTNSKPFQLKKFLMIPTPAVLGNKKQILCLFKYLSPVLSIG